MNVEKIYEARNWASSFLQEHKRETGVVDILLCHYLQASKAQLYGMLRENFDQTLQQKFTEAIKLHATTGVPVQHLTENEEFYGRRFQVNKAVLIPRPETEELVQGVLQTLQAKFPNEPVTVVDVGTGSGVIAISLKKEAEHLDVFATDVSGEALEVATRNAKLHDASITFYQGNFLEPLINKGIKVNVVVSNPPYIAYQDREGLADTVRNYDPELALFADKDGLAAYEEIINQLPEVIDGEGLVAFEIGHKQGPAVKALLQAKFSHTNPEIKQDINGKDRMIFAWI